ncbi:MAG: FKBP-type peptidyl-prolyl cis-trans isomerase [Solirubrobacterales bacterium]
MKSKLAIFLAATAIAVLLAGCGDGDSTGGADSTAQTTGSTTGATAEAGASDSADDAGSGKPGRPPKVSGSLKEKPKIATPAGDPPSKLVTKDIKKGSGKAAKPGDTVAVQYVGLNWSDGAEFDASWTRGEPFEFELGAGAVIAGWDQGVEGMRAGGRRLLVIPPDLGYGDAGQGSIPPGETLVFVVDLEKVS